MPGIGNNPVLFAGALCCAAEVKKLLNSLFPKQFEPAQKQLESLYEKSETNPESYKNSCF